ncbi:Dabb family protein [Lentisphaera profundi]|uniref:Dabb family protein n=1 Tax=Lentisphaera profundi TaxID=1658616 RepID=A0ABY7VXZ3_9BACT|nr:Dabb family protein [Lentisphaera profundi]WDE98791.1 Dabb family protein [Lentisphaera profundi]
MLVHTVFFWLKEDLNEEQKAAFFTGLETLKEIPCSGPVMTGTPSATNKRPVIDDSYDFGLTCVFNSVEEHDVYQTHDIHQKFISGCAQYWSQVKVYDYD